MAFGSPFITGFSLEQLIKIKEIINTLKAL
jgi:hypothetical protein